MEILNIRKYSDKIHAILSSLILDNTDVALMDFPNHSNVGDSAIWLGEEKYLSTRKTCKICTVTDFELPSLPEDAVILIHGGGNFGDLWPRHQAYRERMIRHYRDNRIIQLPQSIHFHDQRNAERCSAALKTHPNFHLLVRDYESLELAGKIYDGPTYLCPDMALCLDSQPRTKSPKYSIVGLLRTDKEKVKTEIQSTLKDDSFYCTDWVYEDTTISQRVAGNISMFQKNYPRWTKWLTGSKPYLFHALARERFKRGCDILSSGEVVITDRLHGHIMCCLLGIPHVVLDNTYRKIGNFRDAWGTGMGLCVSADSFQEAYEKAAVLLGKLRMSINV
jgi:exopolysaccharide biosynthesis predicted pyruvyltransferase EpsI